MTTPCRLPARRRLFAVLALLALLAPGLHAQPDGISGRDIIPDSPAWLHHAVVYQVYPQTFYDTDGDGIGDLRGVTAKLDYIKSLGVDAIWLNPFFDSPFNDAGYDIRDYYKVAPRYGTNEDARQLFAAAHQRGLKVLFDFVASYTAIDHPWFQASAHDPRSPTANWYVWTDNVWKQETNPLFIHGYGQRNGNFLSNFYWCQPALNYGFGEPDPAQPWQLPTNHPAVLAMRAEMKRVFQFWMDLGADGFRADMAGALVKGNDVHHDSLGFWRECRAIMRQKYPDAFMVSEWSGPREALDGAFHADFFHWVAGFDDLYQAESWRILNGMSDGHSFFDRDGRGNIARFLARYLADYTATRAHGYICLPLGNHDNARLANQRSTDDLEIILTFGLTMPGVPFLYYGNETGMRQLPAADQPQIEGAYQPRAGARSPMQWTGGPNLGFSTAAPAKLYLPVDKAAVAPNVAAQENDPDSLLNRTRRLIKLKHTEPALTAYAEFTPLYAKENTYPLVYARASGDNVLLIVLNPAARAETAEFAFTHGSKLTLLAGKPVTVTPGAGHLKLTVPGQTYAIYRVEK